MENGLIASLYADWHTASKSWTWGDCIIFITGHKRKRRDEIGGDPFTKEKELLFIVTNKFKARKVECPDKGYTIVNGFIN